MVKVWIVALALLGAVAPSATAAPSGGITGVIRHSDPLPASAFRAAGKHGATYRVAVDAQGRFTRRLPPGPYTLSLAGPYADLCGSGIAATWRYRGRTFNQSVKVTIGDKMRTVHADIRRPRCPDMALVGLQVVRRPPVGRPLRVPPSPWDRWVIIEIQNRGDVAPGAVIVSWRADPFLPTNRQTNIVEVTPPRPGRSLTLVQPWSPIGETRVVTVRAHVWASQDDYLANNEAQTRVEFLHG